MNLHGNCPKCEHLVFATTSFGMWDDYKPDGTKVGGQIFKQVCAGCDTPLIAFHDVLEDNLVWNIASLTVPKIPN
jgi:hypothetical protein